MTAEERAESIVDALVEMIDAVLAEHGIDCAWAGSTVLHPGHALIAQALRDHEDAAYERLWRVILDDVKDLPVGEHGQFGAVYCANSVEDTIVGPTRRRIALKSKKD